jgi:phosphoglycolate phosphatase-like HAD superfamily hydrolase
MQSSRAELTKDWTDSGDVERTKPQPDLVAAAVEKAGGGPAVMVGDSTWDCEAGATCVFASLSELREQSADTPLS